MRKLLNTLYVNTEDARATLEGANVVIKQKDNEIGRYPLHLFQSIYLFTYSGASPALIGRCAEEGIEVVYCSPQGKFLARVTGRSHGNVLLRRQQYRWADREDKSLELTRSFILGKLYNSRQTLARFKRDHSMQVDSNKFEAVCIYLKDILEQLQTADTIESVRGYEGTAAKLYFGMWDDMILRDKETFYMHDRNRRPPLDKVNALLSYVYTLCGNDCASALEAAGLDSYVGFMHQDRPGRTSLAQDLLEELRSCMCDRFVLKLINNRIVTAGDFEEQADQAVLITSMGRRRILQEWKQRKQTMVIHPYLKEKVEWGMVPYTQAMLLAQYIRGDIDGYPPFLYK